MYSLPITVVATKVVTMVPTACLPKNDFLAKPLSPVLTLFTGGIFGIMNPISILMLIILGVCALVTILTHKGREFIAKMPFLFAVILAVVIGAALLINIPDAVNNAACTA